MMRIKILQKTKRKCWHKDIFPIMTETECAIYLSTKYVQTGIDMAACRGKTYRYTLDRRNSCSVNTGI